MLHLVRKKKKSPPGHHHVIDRLAEANALFGGLALFPQLITVWRSRDVASLSSTSFLVLFIANVVWGIYGFHRKDTAVILSSCLVIISSGGLTLLSLLWK